MKREIIAGAFIVAASIAGVAGQADATTITYDLTSVSPVTYTPQLLSPGQGAAFGSFEYAYTADVTGAPGATDWYLEAVVYLNNQVFSYSHSSLGSLTDAEVLGNSVTTGLQTFGTTGFFQGDAGAMFVYADDYRGNAVSTPTHGSGHVFLDLTDTGGTVLYDLFGPTARIMENLRVELMLYNDVAPVPLPAGMLLLTGALGAFGLVRRRQCKAVLAA